MEVDLLARPYGHQGPPISLLTTKYERVNLRRAEFYVQEGLSSHIRD